MLNSISNKLKNFLKKISLSRKEQWYLSKLFNKREAYLIFALLMIALIAGIILARNFYLINTYQIPSEGGKYTEGIIGSPRYINPVLCQTNDADRDIARVVFSSLFKYDEKGNLIPDLVKNYKISEDGKTYEVEIKNYAKWHDGVPLNVDDVIYTLQVIKDPEYQSPLRLNWEGVEIEKLDEYRIKFHLKQNSYAPFLQNLTFGILPKHIWSGISPENFLLAEYNLKPIGSGPYKFKKFKKNKDGGIESIYLESFQDYYNHKALIKNLNFYFYPDETSAINALKIGEIEGISFIRAKNLSKIENLTFIKTYKISLPRYYAVFFNQNQNKVLADNSVRKALAYATNKKEIIQQIFNGQAEEVNSPIPKGVWGHNNQIDIYDYSLTKAQDVLDKAGWQDTDEDGIREKKIRKERTPLKLTLTTTDWPDLQRTADLLKKQWEKIGAEIEINIVPSNEIQQNYIKPREYEALLFGEVLTNNPDPFSFWHSSQSRDPGLNLSLYNNAKVDKFLEEGRETLNEQERIERYAEFQKIVSQELPALFLYNPTYLYPVHKKVKGINLEKVCNPSYRFSEVEKYYIKTKRHWK